VEVASIPYRELSADRVEESSAEVRERVIGARAFQLSRAAEGVVPRNKGESARETIEPSEINRQGSAVNATLSHGEIRRWCPLDGSGQRLMEVASDRMGLSARGVTRVLRVARTIADLAGEERIGEEHLAEAVQYRGG
jgi:magnesium chelatase family protein